MSKVNKIDFVCKCKSSINNISNNKKAFFYFCFSVLFITFIVELLNKNLLYKISLPAFNFNIILVILVYLFFICLTNKFRLSIIISNILLFLLGFANYSLLTIRGTPLSLLDILSIKTGLTLADSYYLQVSPYFIFAIIGFFLLLFLNVKINFNSNIMKSKKSIWLRIISIIIIILLLFLFIKTQFIGIFNLYTDLWMPSQEYQINGFLASFVKQINDLSIKKPAEYSISKIQEIYSSTISSKSINHEKEDRSFPNIIVVMNESFADMRIHRDFNTSEEFIPYFKSLCKESISGYVHTSVYGGRTPNSEWEFLTNNSMAFFSYGSIPYQQFIRDRKYSLVSTLKDQGYSTSAIHTWYKTGYRRNSVYPLLGFESTLFYDDIEGEIELIRDYPSDLSTYKLLIKEYEERDVAKPFFNFTVTMQNHCGYDYLEKNFPSSVFLTDIPNCPRVEQYLSLIKESDKALKYLIDYFKNAEQDTIILFYGDHQPPYLDKEFWYYVDQNNTGSLEDQEKSYITPYFIWANYDLPDVNVPDISLNYMSTLLLDLIGLKTTPYQDYLRNMQEEIPVITGHGYMDKTGIYHDFTEENEYTPLILSTSFVTTKESIG